MKMDSLSAFDFIVVVLLAIGIFRGKKRGMSEELLDLFQWLLIVVLGALFYKPLGKLVANFTHASLLVSYIASYLTIAAVLKLVFSAIKRAVGEKLMHADAFGRFEYYLGMLAGMTRWGCMLLVFMAILHAKYISDAERAAEAKLQKDNFGSISFPTFASLQQTVFFESMSGMLVRKHLANQLIEAVGPSTAPPTETIGKRRERAVDEVLGTKPGK